MGGECRYGTAGGTLVAKALPNPSSNSSLGAMATRGPSFGGIVLGQVKEFGIGAGVVLIDLYFLLASIDLSLRKTEGDRSAHLLTVSAIHLGLAVDGLLSFVPQLGGPVTFGLLCVVSISSFDHTSRVLIPPPLDGANEVDHA